MKRLNKRVVVGGTFETLHKGHRALLKKAFNLGKVVIGLTSNSFAWKMKKRKVADFQIRKKQLTDFILKNFSAKPKIVKIENKFGFTRLKNFDFIAVSPETYPAALEINKERKRRKRKPIKIVKINFVLAEDKKPISSTRILKGEINSEGKLLR